MPRVSRNGVSEVVSEAPCLGLGDIGMTGRKRCGWLGRELRRGRLRWSLQAAWEAQSAVQPQQLESRPPQPQQSHNALPPSRPFHHHRRLPRPSHLSPQQAILTAAVLVAVQRPTAAVRPPPLLTAAVSARSQPPPAARQSLSASGGQKIVGFSPHLTHVFQKRHQSHF